MTRADQEGAPAADFQNTEKTISKSKPGGFVHDWEYRIHDWQDLLESRRPMPENHCCSHCLRDSADRAICGSRMRGGAGWPAEQRGAAGMATSLLSVGVRSDRAMICSALRMWRKHCVAAKCPECSADVKSLAAAGFKGAGALCAMPFTSLSTTGITM